jgi:glycosyltransferase involved in cell wall biosynthesis
MSARKNYLIVIPAFNEESSIARVIDDARLSVPFADIVVVDDGSVDATAAQAAAKDVFLVRHPFNLGYGSALQTGFRFASAEEYDYIITMDGDGQHVASSVTNLITAMEKMSADIVIGSRFLSGEYKTDGLRKIGIFLFSLVGKAYTGKRITDPTSGFQLISRKVFSYLALKDNYPLDYPDINIIMALHKMKFRVAEAPVRMVANRSGKSMHRGFRPIAYVIRMFLAIILVLARGEGE